MNLTSYMGSLPNRDKSLNEGPPDKPYQAQCEFCDEWFNEEDLEEHKGHLLCEECLAEVIYLTT